MLYKICCSTLILCISLIEVQAQCMRTILWPTTPVIAPMLSGVSEHIDAYSQTIDYARIIDIQAGQYYKFSSDIETDFITVVESGTMLPIAFGATPLIVLTTSNLDLEVHWSADNTCGSDAYSRATRIECLSCIPVNDACADAIFLDINAGFACANSVQGTASAATFSTATPSPCVGLPVNDIWYAFVATSNTHIIQVSNNTGTLVEYEILTGLCAGSASLLCGNMPLQEINGLNIGDTYYIRVYEMQNTGNFTDLFNLCIGTHEPPSNVYFENVTTNSALMHWTVGEAAAIQTLITLCPSGVAMSNSSCQTFSTNNASPYDFTNLTSCTDYDVYLLEEHSSSGQSPAVGAYSIQTDGPLNLHPICGDIVQYPPCPETDYPIEDNITFNVCPSLGERISVSFTHFDLEVSTQNGLDGNGCWDYIEIFDEATSLGTYCSEASGDGDAPANPRADLSLQAYFIAATVGDCLSLTLHSDGIVQETGFIFKVTCIDACPDSLYVPNIVLSETYPSRKRTYSDGRIENGQNVIFESDCIELQSGFEVELGAEFLGHINPCTSSLLDEEEN